MITTGEENPERACAGVRTSNINNAANAHKATTSALMRPIINIVTVRISTINVTIIPK